MRPVAIVDEDAFAAFPCALSMRFYPPYFKPRRAQIRRWIELDKRQWTPGKYNFVRWSFRPNFQHDVAGRAANRMCS